ncbi:MAG TPA: hypothetical protein VMH27_19135 [Puia sp.]|nr:hypothetical protein [Puia sp.]
MLGATTIALIISLFLFNHSDYSPKYSLSSPPEYTNLFDDSAKTKMTLYITNLIKGRNPISQYIYDSDYSVIAYLMDFKTDAPLDSLLRSGTGKPGLHIGSNYPTLHIGQLALSYAADSVQPSSHLTISFFGDSVFTVFRTKAVWCIRQQMSAVVIENGRHNADITLTPFALTVPKVPIEIAFIRNNDGVFLLIISPTSRTRGMPDDLAKSVINKTLFEK